MNDGHIIKWVDRRRRSFGKAAAIIGLVLAFAAISGSLFGDTLVGMLVGVSLVLSVYPFTRYQEDRTPFAPIYVLSILLGFSYPIRLIIVMFFEEYAGVDRIAGPLFSDLSLIRHAMWLTTLGQVALLIGYYKAPKLLVKPLQNSRWSFEGKPHSLPFKAFILSYLAWALLISRKSLGFALFFDSAGSYYSPATNQVLSFLGQLNLFAASLSIVWLCMHRGKKKRHVLVFLSVLPLFVHPLLFDPQGKTALLNAAFLVVAAFVTAGRRLHFSYIILALVYLVFFVWPFVSSYRNLLQVENVRGSELTSISNQLKYSYEALSRTVSLEFPLEDRISDFTRRFGALDATLVTVAYVPSAMPYAYFEDVRLVPFVLIPRLIFPVKPISETQRLYSQDVYGMTQWGVAAPFIIGEGYLNAGAIGVPILAFAWGVMWAMAYHGFFSPRRGEIVAVALYVAFLTRFISSFEWALLSLIGMPGFLLVWAPAIYWCARKK